MSSPEASVHSPSSARASATGISGEEAHKRLSVRWWLGGDGLGILFENRKVRVTANYLCVGTIIVIGYLFKITNEVNAAAHGP